jgi:prepilin-type N-terminal cleavage/methylation domain-containing protein
MNKNRRGMTLIEVLIASAILSIVVAIAMSVLTSGTQNATSGQLMSQLEERGNRIQAFCRDQLSTAAYTHPTYTNLGIVPASFNTAIGFQMSGPANAASTGTPTLTFGYVDPRIKVDPVVQPVDPTLACFIRFEADTVYMESAASPSATQAANWIAPGLPAFPTIPVSTLGDPSQLIVRVLNMDVNGNGSKTDTFVSGKLMKYVWDEANNVLIGREKLDDQVILRVNSSAAGDFAGSINETLDPVSGTLKKVNGLPRSSNPAIPVLTPDYLFMFTDINGAIDPSLTGATAYGLMVNVWHGCIDQDGKHFILRNSRQLIHIRTELKGG